MNLEKYFGDIFNAKCIVTDHAVERINQRFMFAELAQLKLLVQAGLRYQPLEKWHSDKPVAIVDPRFNFSILSSYYPKENIIKVLTFIRGKEPQAYKDCQTITVSILKEKADQDVVALNQLNKQMQAERRVRIK